MRATRFVNATIRLCINQWRRAIRRGAVSAASFRTARASRAIGSKIPKVEAAIGYTRRGIVQKPYPSTDQGYRAKANLGSRGEHRRWAFNGGNTRSLLPRLLLTIRVPQGFQLGEARQVRRLRVGSECKRRECDRLKAPEVRRTLPLVFDLEAPQVMSGLDAATLSQVGRCVGSLKLLLVATKR